MSKIDLYPTKVASPSTARVATGTDFPGDKVALDVNVQGGTVTGEFSPSGLRVDMRITTMNVTDVATALPATPLTARNTISIANLSTVETLYLGKATVVSGRAIGTTAGWEVGPNENFNVDIQDDIIIYGIAEAGKTILVKVMEFA